MSDSPLCDRCGGATFEEYYDEWVCTRCDAVVGPVEPQETASTERDG